MVYSHNYIWWYCVTVLVTIIGQVLQQQLIQEQYYHQCLQGITIILSASYSIMNYHQNSGIKYDNMYHYTHCIVIFTNVQVSIMFAGNRAIIGSAIYANNLDLCSWYSFNPPYFYSDRSKILHWSFISYRQLQLQNY